jgi:hypothetical protein
MVAVSLQLLDNTLHVNIFFEASDGDLADNICLCVRETCPDDERLFRAEETHIFLTAQEALALADALRQAASSSPHDAENG